METNEINNGEKNKGKNEKEENRKSTILTNSNYKIEILKEDILSDGIISKIIIIGDSGVGKTSLSLRITKNLFEEAPKTTVGFDIFKYIAKVNELVIKLQIWDTCGLEEFSSCTPSLYKNAALAIIVYSIDNKKSFEHLENWKNLVKENASPETIIFIVGNKKDLNNRKIKTEQGEEFKNKYDFQFFTETSAKENEFVNDLFQQALIKIYEQHKEKQKGDGKEREDFKKKKIVLVLRLQTMEIKKRGVVNKRLIIFVIIKLINIKFI